MRKLALTVAATAVILAVGSLSAYRAEAMTLGPAGVRAAIDAVNPVEKTACWRWGWHGWGWYPCYRYYGYRPYYHGWRWRRWHRW